MDGDRLRRGSAPGRERDPAARAAGRRGRLRLIGDAVLYLPGPGDLSAAALHVAGRPIVFRAVVATVRAGAERVHVPRALRDVLTPALAASPTARRAVAWMDTSHKPPADGALVVPITAPPPSLTLTLLRRATPTAVVHPSRRGIPVAVVPSALLEDLWSSLCGAVPVGDELDALLKEVPCTAVRAEPGAHVCDAAAVRGAEDRLYAGLGSVIDSPLDIAVHRRLSRHVSRFAVARGIPPNPITAASLLVGLAAAASFAMASPLTALGGLALYLIAVVLDHADGEVARLTLTESRFGARFDVVADTVVHAAVVIALGVATRSVSGGGIALGLIAALGIVASATAAVRWPVSAGEDRVGTLLENLGSRDGFYVMLLLFLIALGVAPSWLPVLMALVAAGSHAYWVGRLAYRLARRSHGRGNFTRSG